MLRCIVNGVPGARIYGQRSGICFRITIQSIIATAHNHCTYTYCQKRLFHNLIYIVLSLSCKSFAATLMSKVLYRCGMKSLLLLHGALGSGAQFSKLNLLLGDFFDVHILTLPGHGGTAGDDFSIPGFARFVQDHIEEKGLDQPAVFGYSMGGYVALHLASQNPGLFGSACTLATKFEWDETIAAKEVRMLNPEVMEAKVPLFAAELAERHQPSDWKEVVRQTANLLEGLGRNNLLTADAFAAISIPVLVMLGDKDRMVSLDETVTAAKALPAGQLAVLPNTQHPWEAVDPQLVAYLLKRFIQPLP